MSFNAKRKRIELKPLGLYQNNLGYVAYKNLDLQEDNAYLEEFWSIIKTRTKISDASQFSPVLCVTNHVTTSQSKKACSAFVPKSALSPNARILIVIAKARDRSLFVIGAIPIKSPVIMFAHVIPFGTNIGGVKIDEEYKSIRLPYLSMDFDKVIKEAISLDTTEYVEYDADIPEYPVDYKIVQALHVERYKKPDSVKKFVVAMGINLRLDSLFHSTEPNIQSEWLKFSLEYPCESLFIDYLVCIACSAIPKIHETYIEGYSSCAAVCIRLLENPFDRQHCFIKNGFEINEQTLLDVYGQNIDVYFMDHVKKQCKKNIASTISRFDITPDNPTGMLSLVTNKKYNTVMTHLGTIYELCTEITNTFINV